MLWSGKGARAKSPIEIALPFSGHERIRSKDWTKGYRLWSRSEQSGKRLAVETMESLIDPFWLLRRCAV